MPGNTDPAFGGVTRTVDDSTMPFWNQVVTPAMHPVAASVLVSPVVGRWKLWVGDDDGCSTGSCLAQEICEVDSLSPNALESGQALFQNIMSCNSLVLKLACVTPTP
jgi:hypothetical protein